MAGRLPAQAKVLRARPAVLWRRVLAAPLRLPTHHPPTRHAQRNGVHSKRPSFAQRGDGQRWGLPACCVGVASAASTPQCCERAAVRRVFVGPILLLCELQSTGTGVCRCCERAKGHAPGRDPAISATCRWMRVAMEPSNHCAACLYPGRGDSDPAWRRRLAGVHNERPSSLRRATQAQRALPAARMANLGRGGYRCCGHGRKCGG